MKAQKIPASLQEVERADLVTEKIGLLFEIPVTSPGPMGDALAHVQ